MMAQTFQAPGENRLLALLPPAEAERLIAQMERRSIPIGDVIVRQNSSISHVLFPLTVVTSVLKPFDDGASVEVATIGNEGMIGYTLLLGQNTMPNDVVGQVPGDAYVMRAAAFREDLGKDGPLRTIIGRYTLALMNQMSQSVGCNVRHSIEQRCARWLLMTHDRVGKDNFPLTHEYLAMMLGVRRAGVTVAAGALQRRGLIAYHRGLITILDREGLEMASCLCYQTGRAEFERILGS
jgi:CRP-like cAMP-binding protein